MNDTDHLLRELIGEVRALREGLATAHARHMGLLTVYAGMGLTSEALSSLVTDYFQEVMRGGRPVAATAAAASAQANTDRVVQALAELRQEINGLMARPSAEAARDDRPASIAEFEREVDGAISRAMMRRTP